MTTIRTTCQECGDVELSTGDIALQLGGSGDTGSYKFDCPSCSSTQVRPASRRVVSILLATGVSYEVAQAIAPINERDIDEFRMMLVDDDWFSKLLATDG